MCDCRTSGTRSLAEARHGPPCSVSSANAREGARRQALGPRGAAGHRSRAPKPSAADGRRRASRSEPRARRAAVSWAAWGPGLLAACCPCPWVLALAVRSEGARPPAHLCSVAGTDQWATRLHPEGEGWKVQTRCHSHPADPPQCPQARGPVLDGRKGTSPGLSLSWARSPRRPAQRRAGGSVSFAGVGRVDRVWAGWPGGCDLGATLLSEALHMGRPWGTTRGVSK